MLRYKYVNSQGAVVGVKIRRPGKRFQWQLPEGNPHILYRLPEVVEAVGNTVYLVEGEKDADRLRSTGVVATTCGGASDVRKCDLSPLAALNVVVIPDNDPAGLKMAQTLANRLGGVHVADVSTLPHKGDVSDLLDAGGSIADLPKEWLPAAVAQPSEGIRVVQATSFRSTGELRQPDLPEYFKGTRLEHKICPAHADKIGSLSVKLADDRWLLYCHAGCDTEEIMMAVGLGLADLFSNAEPVEEVSNKLKPQEAKPTEALLEVAPEYEAVREEFIQDMGAHSNCRGANRLKTKNTAEGGGVSIWTTCKMISCDICGPRLRHARYLFVKKAFGAQAWIGTFHQDVAPKLKSGYVRIPHGQDLITLIAAEEFAGANFEAVTPAPFQMHCPNARLFSMAGSTREQWVALGISLFLITQQKNKKRLSSRWHYWVPMEKVSPEEFQRVLEECGHTVSVTNNAEGIELEWVGDASGALLDLKYVNMSLFAQTKAMPEGWLPPEERTTFMKTTETDLPSTLPIPF